jgi:hypothetical protein
MTLPAERAVVIDAKLFQEVKPADCEWCLQVIVL